MPAFQYRQGRAFFHQVDLGSKLLWLLGTSVLAFTLSGPILGTALLALTSVTAVALAGLTARELWGPVRYFMTVGVSFLVLQTLFGPGTHVFAQIGPLAAKTEGVVVGATIAIRLMVIGIVSLAFTRTTDPRAVAVGLVKYVRLPYRYAYMAVQALRFMPLMEDEFVRIHDAHTVRGAAVGRRGLIGTVQEVRQYSIPLLVRGLKRAQTGALAMEARGFGAFPQRTFLYELPPRSTLGLLHGGLYAIAAVVSLALAIGGPGLGTRVN